jgi:hypothetical protein
MKGWQAVAAFAAGAGLFALGAAWSQQSGNTRARLTAEDYAEIEQLIYTYGYAIDTCAADGYEYADLYTEDGVFVDHFTDAGFAAGGLVRAVGREQLARASGGGELRCENVGWKDWSHVMVNPVIKPTPAGASGRTYSVVIGEQGPTHVQRFGGYEDEFVRTSDGWRIKKRTHVRNKAWSHPLLRSADLH